MLVSGAKCIRVHPAGLQTTPRTNHAHYYMLRPHQIWLRLGKLTEFALLSSSGRGNVA